MGKSFGIFLIKKGEVSKKDLSVDEIQAQRAGFPVAGYKILGA
jgi:hypothetical protein